MIRISLVTAFTALLAVGACASDPVRPAPGGPPLTADLIPLAGPAARFASDQGELTIRIEPRSEGAATWFIGGGSGPESQLDVAREGQSIVFRDAPGRAVEILRLGAEPGASWQSSGQHIRFEGWERLETPAGVFDAARVRTQTLSKMAPEIETWWFAPDVGVVRYDQSKNLNTESLYGFSMRRIE